MRKNRHNKNYFFVIVFMIISLFLLNTIAYSAVNVSLDVSGTAQAKFKKDIRITKFRINETYGGAISSYEEFNKDTIKTNVTFPNSSSYIIFSITVRNYGNVKMGIREILGYDDQLYYEILDYTMKDSLKDNDGNSIFGAEKTFRIKMYPKLYNTNNLSVILSLQLKFDIVYNIKYTNISNSSFPTEIMKDETLSITFSDPIPTEVEVYEDGYLGFNYNYLAPNLKVYTVNANLEIICKINKKVYLNEYQANGLFWEFLSEEEISKIKTLSFVSFDDSESAFNGYKFDVSLNGDGSVMLWLDSNYNAYIGTTHGKIYCKNLASFCAFTTGLTSIDFSNLDTSETINMQSLFLGCESLQTLDLSSFDTSHVTDMCNMFYNCKSLKTLDLSSFNTSNVTNMGGMFFLCTALSSVNVSTFDTSKVNNMEEMFSNCLSLKSLDLSNFNTSNVTNIKSFVAVCSALESINLSSFNVYKIVDFTNFFSHCESLIKLDLSNFIISGFVNFDNMFYGMYNLKELNIENFNTRNAVSYANMFATDRTSNLNKIIIGNDFYFSNINSVFPDSSTGHWYGSNKKEYLKTELNGVGGTYTSSSSYNGIVRMVSGDINNPQIGDMFAIKNERFYIFASDATSVTGIAEYNLYVGGYTDTLAGKTWNPYGVEATGIQNKDMRGQYFGYDIWNGTTAFSDMSSGTLNSYSGSLAEGYVNSYHDILVGYGVKIEEARLISSEELVNIFKCSERYRDCPTTHPWIYATSYWTGSKTGGANVYTVSSNRGFAGQSYSYNLTNGIRPVIKIPKYQF